MMGVATTFLGIIAFLSPLLITITGPYRGIHVKREMIKSQLRKKPLTKIVKRLTTLLYIQLLEKTNIGVVARTTLPVKYLLQNTIVAMYSSMGKSICPKSYTYPKSL